MRRGYGVDIHVRGTAVTVSGPALPASTPSSLLSELIDVARTGTLTRGRRRRARRQPAGDLHPRPREGPPPTTSPSPPRPRHPPQVPRPEDLHRRHQSITFGIGPAGHQLKLPGHGPRPSGAGCANGSRASSHPPAVEAGENAAEAASPLNRPLRPDALHDMLGPGPAPPRPPAPSRSRP